MKISIIGGGGRVGSDAAYALQMSNVAHEMVLVDANPDAASGEALDMLHGTSAIGNQKIIGGGYDEITGSDTVVITAGLRRKPDESRLDLISRNVALFRQILNDLKHVKLAPEATILVVSNPVDILTCLAVETGMLPPQQIIGLGTVLDTTRFRSLIGYHFEINPNDVQALILGEHGDSMVPIWSTASINGIPIESFKAFNTKKTEEIFEQTKKAGAEVIRLKGGAGRAVGVSIRTVIEAIKNNSRALLPISSHHQGALGIHDVCLSLPTLVGRKGALQVIEPKIHSSEKEALLKSAESLKSVLKQVQ